MAKRKRNIKKKHNSEHNDQDFLQSAPERSESEWGEESPLKAAASDDVSEVVEYEHEPQNEKEMLFEEEETDVSSAPKFENELSLGKYLREQRESQRISLKSVSQSTKISFTNLEYLENDDLKSLPDRAYVTGYVKSYSKLIGLDTNFCLKLLEKTYQSLGAKPREPEIVIPQAQNSPQMVNQLPMAKVGAVLAMLAVIGAISIFFINRKDNGPEIPVAESPTEQDASEKKEIQPQTLNAESPLQGEISSNSDDDSFEDSNETNLQNETEKEIKEELPKEVKVVETKVPPKETTPVKANEEKKEDKKDDEVAEDRKFYPLTLPLYSINKDLTSDQINELLPASSRTTVQEGQQAIYIRANKGDSWLTYKKDDDPIKKFVLKEGRSLLFVANEARVFLGNIGGVTIFLNNQPLKISSRTGVKSIVFPQENADKYVMPLFIYRDDGSVMTSEEWLKSQAPQ